MDIAALLSPSADAPASASAPGSTSAPTSAPSSQPQSQAQSQVWSTPNSGSNSGSDARRASGISGPAPGGVIHHHHPHHDPYNNDVNNHHLNPNHNHQINSHARIDSYSHGRIPPPVGGAQPQGLSPAHSHSARPDGFQHHLHPHHQQFQHPQHPHPHLQQHHQQHYDQHYELGQPPRADTHLRPPPGSHGPPPPQTHPHHDFHRHPGYPQGPRDVQPNHSDYARNSHVQNAQNEQDHRQQQQQQQQPPQPLPTPASGVKNNHNNANNSHRPQPHSHHHSNSLNRPPPAATPVGTPVPDAPHSSRMHPPASAHPSGPGKPPVTFLLDGLYAGHRGLSSDLLTLSSIYLPSIGLAARDVQEIQDLINRLADDGSNYWAYIGLINRLHAYFVDRCRAYQSNPQTPRPDRQDAHPEAGAHASRTPRDINAIAILLEKARVGYSCIYTPSEEMWLDWITDDISLACSLRDRRHILDKCQRAIESVPSSVKLWLLFTRTITRWWLLCTRSLDESGLELLLGNQYFAPLDIPSGRVSPSTSYSESDPARWPDREGLDIQHVFNWPAVSYFWTSALAATCSILSCESGVLVSIFSQVVAMRLGQLEHRIHECKNLPHDEGHALDRDLHAERTMLIGHFRSLLETRLCSPHITWDETSSIYSNFISQYYGPGVYESAMVEITHQAEPAKGLMRDRVDFENRLTYHHPDENALLESWFEYIAWEKSAGRKLARQPRGKNVTERQLSDYASEQSRLDGEWRHRICALYDRLLSLFPIREDLWIEWIDWLGVVERELSGDSAGGASNLGSKMPANLLAVLHRGSSFCPWSGSIWEIYIQALESTGASFEECADVKHKATSSGLLERSGLEQLFKVYLAWCGFLHRRASVSSVLSKDADEREEMFDVAEVGIRSALEHVREVVKALDSSRLEKIRLPSDVGRDPSPSPSPAPGPTAVPVIHYTGDPQLRLERIFLKFATDRGNFVMVRECFDYLADYCGNSTEFWQQYYLFEMMAWTSAFWSSSSATPATANTNTHAAARVSGSEDLLLAVPRQATRVLYEAMKRIEVLNEPYELTVFLINHCVQYETIDVVRNVTIDIRAAQKALAERGIGPVKKTRQSPVGISGEGAAPLVAAAQQDDSQMAVDSVEVPEREQNATVAAAGRDHQGLSVKRKFEVGGAGGDGDGAEPYSDAPSNMSKKAKIAEEAAVNSSAAPASVGGCDNEKRDREHNSIIVGNLPSSATVGSVKRFFDGCGGILSVQIVEARAKDDGETRGANGDGASDVTSDETKTGFVEFECRADAEFALTRQVKPFDESGRLLSLSFAEETTLWLTNYPSDGDEQYLRRLVEPLGQIVQIRLPSLAKNPHRRFCYITMIDPSTAKKVESALDGKMLHDEVAGRDVKLVCKLSDPDKRSERKGPMYEGREIIVRNWHYEGTEAELRAFVLDVMRENDGFTGGDADGESNEKGAIERVRIPKAASGKGKGSGFVVFSKPEFATKAAELLSGRTFKGRSVSVEVTSPDHKHAKRTATIVATTAGSPGGTVNGSRSREHTADRMLDTGAGTETHADRPSAEDANSKSNSKNDGKDRSSSDPSSSFHSTAARSMTLSNVPDTISSAYIQKLVSKYGDIKKINLRPSAGTAVVEFLHEASVGKACLGLDRMDLNSVVISAEPGIGSGGNGREGGSGGGGGDAGTGSGAKTRIALGSGFVARPRGGGSGMRGRGRVRPTFSRN